MINCVAMVSTKVTTGRTTIGTAIFDSTAVQSETGMFHSVQRPEEPGPYGGVSRIERGGDHLDADL